MTKIMIFYFIEYVLNIRQVNRVNFSPQRRYQSPPHNVVFACTALRKGKIKILEGKRKKHPKQQEYILRGNTYDLRPLTTNQRNLESLKKRKDWNSWAYTLPQLLAQKKDILGVGNHNYKREGKRETMEKV